MSILTRNNVHIRGTGDRTMVFAHGFGCDQNMWRFVAPSFEKHFSTVLFDHVGAGRSDRTAYTPERYGSLHGYAQDVVELGLELNLDQAVFVGHSSSAMIGALASIKAPGMFESLALLAPSPRYTHDGDYLSAFTEPQLDDLLTDLERDYFGWAGQMAPAIMGNAERPELGLELTTSFRQTDASIAKHAARTLFKSDSRADLARVTARSLILQCREDVLAPVAVGEYTHRRLRDSRLVLMRARGHCPHMSAPRETVAAIGNFVLASRSPARGGPRPDPGAKLRAQRRRRHSAQTTRHREGLRHSLLYRAGELRMHLGRYDMYAVALAAIVALEPPAAPTPHWTVETRGAAILQRMDERAVARHIIDQFRSIDAELKAVLDRQEISARNAAIVAAVALVPAERGQLQEVHHRDWYDCETAGIDDITRFIEDMERDILKVASLYVRVANCALKLRDAFV